MSIAATGFVTPLVDLPDPRRGHVRGEPAARPDALVGERRACPGIFFAGTIGQGAKGLQQARHPVQLGGGPWRALQRPRAGRAHRPDAVRDRARAAARSRRRRRRRLPGDRAGRGARAVPPARLPRPGADRRPVGRACATTGSSRSPTSSTRTARTRWSPSLEADGTGAIYPVLYSRIGGKVVERAHRPRPAAPLRHGSDARRGDRRRQVVPARSRRRTRSLAEASGARDAPRRQAEALARRPRPRRASRAASGKANRSLVRPSSGREKNDEPGTAATPGSRIRRMRERDVVLVGQVADVGHDVVRARRLVDAEAGRPQGRQEGVAPRAVARRRGRRSSRPGTRARRPPRPAAARRHRPSGSRGRAGSRPTGRAARSPSRSASRSPSTTSTSSGSTRSARPSRAASRAGCARPRTRCARRCRR